MLVSGLHVTNIRRLIAYAIVSLAFAIAFASDSASAQAPASDPPQNEAELPEQSKKAPIRSTPLATERKSADRQKRPLKPFIPTERIEADSIISFPSNI